MCWKMHQEESLENLFMSGFYVNTKREMSNIPMVKRIAKMFFSSRMNNRLIRKRVLI